MAETIDPTWVFTGVLGSFIVGIFLGMVIFYTIMRVTWNLRAGSRDH